MLFNLANQYAINEMYTEALNTYQVIVKNKMFSNAGKSSCQRCACFHSCGVLQRSNICAAQNISLHHLFTSHCNNTTSTAPQFNVKNNPTCMHSRQWILGKTCLLWKGVYNNRYYCVVCEVPLTTAFALTIHSHPSSNCCDGWEGETSAV